MNKRPLVICTHRIPEVGIKILEEEMEIIILDNQFPIDVQLKTHLPQADFLIPLLSVNISEDLLGLATNLKGIANYAVGYNNIDISAAQKKGILVTNTPDVLTNATADLAWGLILALTRRIIEGDKVCRDNAFQGWLPEYLLGYEVTGKTLGIVGLGRIGTAIAKRALGFEMKILYHSRTRKIPLESQYNFVFKSDLNRLLREADIISLNVPYLKETHHLIAEKELKLMKSSSFLINTARGRIINEKDLISALKDGIIAGAGLDVFYNEPEIPQELRELNNVVLTPHIGSATVQARELMSQIVAENILAINQGMTPPNLVPELR